MPLPLLHRSLLAVPLALSSGAAAADTLVVDDTPGPGVDFSSIQEAATAASPGDLLLVRPGTYAGFSTTKGLKIMGPVNGVAQVNGPVVITSLPADQLLHLSRLTMPGGIEVNDCFGAVLMEHVLGLSFGDLQTDNCADVRARASSFANEWSPPVGAYGGTLIELVDVESFARDMVDVYDGTDGLAVRQGTTAIVARSRFRGGAGGDCFTIDCYEPTYGGNGMEIYEATLLMTGSPFWPAPDPIAPSWSLGGDAGSTLNETGVAGHGLLLDGDARIFGVDFGGGSPNGLPIKQLFGSTLDVPTTPDPDLVLLTEPTAGPGPLAGRRGNRTVDLLVRGEPGANVRLAVGRRPVFEPHAVIPTPRLVFVEELHPIGALGAGGTLQHTLKIPFDRSVGDVVVLQADVVPAGGGTTRRTHSLHFMVR